MALSIVLSLAAALLVGLIRAEKTENPRRILAFKAPLSLLFIVAWGLQPSPYAIFSCLILTALLFCLAGDILLAFTSRNAFLLGLISFLLGHGVYAAAFFVTGAMGPWMAPGVFLVSFSGVLIWRWLEPHLGSMKIPVLAYIVVISIMLCGAWGIIGSSVIPLRARMGILAGAALFYLSDICVARQRFVVNTPINRSVGLPLYYTAQFLLAFSSPWVPT